MSGRGLLSRFLGDRRGSALVEFSIAAPMLVILSFGAIEVGRALQQHHVMNKAVRDAARYLARAPLACPATADAASWAAAKTRATNLALTGRITGGTPLVANWTAATFTIADPVCETWSGRNVQVLTVSADEAYDDLGFVDLIGMSGFRLTAAHQQVHIGE